MKKINLLLMLAVGFFLAGCGASQVANASNPGIANVESLPAATSPAHEAPETGDLVRTDDQGNVSMSVKPLNLTSPGDTLDFEVRMNTHSVDLDMDVSSLATLATDSGITAQGIGWDGQSGGHHVTGRLSFPASVEGGSILDGATVLTLTIRNIDAPERVFSWSVNQ